MFQFRIKIKEIILCVRARIISLSYLDSATNDEFTRWKVADSLNKIVQNNQMPSVVSALQHFLCNSTYETNFYLYKNSF